MSVFDEFPPMEHTYSKENLERLEKIYNSISPVLLQKLRLKTRLVFGKIDLNKCCFCDQKCESIVEHFKTNHKEEYQKYINRIKRTTG